MLRRNVDVVSKRKILVEQLKIFVEQSSLRGTAARKTNGTKAILTRWWPEYYVPATLSGS
jgi:hypothetical protein